MKKLIAILFSVLLFVSAWSIISNIKRTPVISEVKSVQTVPEKEAVTPASAVNETKAQTGAQSEAPTNATIETTAFAQAETVISDEYTEAVTSGLVQAKSTDYSVIAKPVTVDNSAKKIAEPEIISAEEIERESAKPVIDTADDAQYAESVLNALTVTAEAPQTVSLNASDTVYTPSVSDIVKVDDNMGYVDDTIVVFFEENVSAFRKYTIIDSVGGTFVGYLPLIDRYQVKVGKGTFEQLQAKCATLMEYDEVMYAASDIYIKKESTDSVVPDDPWYVDIFSDYSNTYGWSEVNPSGSNWHLKTIQAPSAWAYNDYFSTINIGIVDSGFETEHEDLAGKISFPKKWLEKSNIPDKHGTHVSGIIGATANNQKGITGICWNSNLICVDWEAEENQHWISDLRIYTGFIYAVKAGAKVINFSLGSAGSFTVADTEKFITKVGMNIEARIFSLTMAKLLRRGYDFIAVQSAGNGSEDGYAIDSFYNGSFCTINSNNVMTCLGVKKQEVLDRIIVVGSVRNCGSDEFEQSSFSDGGSQVDICAPGSNIFSTVLTENGGYSNLSGTSMSAPMVTGVTAMVWSVNPKLTGSEVRNIVCDPANTIYEAKDNTSEWHPTTDTYRIINAKLSVEAALRISRERGDIPAETTTETATTPSTTVTTTIDNTITTSPILTREPTVTAETTTVPSLTTLTPETTTVDEKVTETTPAITTVTMPLAAKQVATEN